MIDKIIVRKNIKNKISELGGVLRSEYSAIIRQRLNQLPEYVQAEKVFIYISFDNEVHTKDIIKDALNMDKRVFVPNIVGNTMNMIEIDKNTSYTINNYGIVEPVINDNREIYTGEIDAAIMPLIGYDRNLNRLGRGGGFYDKFLYNRDCIKIAIAFSVQEADKLSTEAHDIKVDIIVTDSEIIR